MLDNRFVHRLKCKLSLSVHTIDTKECVRSSFCDHELAFDVCRVNNSQLDDIKPHAQLMKTGSIFPSRCLFNLTLRCVNEGVRLHGISSVSYFITNQTTYVVTITRYFCLSIVLWITPIVCMIVIVLYYCVLYYRQPRNRVHNYIQLDSINAWM